VTEGKPEKELPADADVEEASIDHRREEPVSKTRTVSPPRSTIPLPFAMLVFGPVSIFVDGLYLEIQN